jgi:hypothetical protein
MSGKKIGRRDAIGLMGAASAAVALGCSESPVSPTTTTTTTTGSNNAACAVTPTDSR